MERKPKIDTPLPDFLVPVFRAYAKGGANMTLEAVEEGVVYIAIHGCGG